MATRSRGFHSDDSAKTVWLATSHNHHLPPVVTITCHHLPPCLCLHECYIVGPVAVSHAQPAIRCNPCLPSRATSSCLHVSCGVRLPTIFHPFAISRAQLVCWPQGEDTSVEMIDEAQWSAKPSDFFGLDKCKVGLCCTSTCVVECTPTKFDVNISSREQHKMQGRLVTLPPMNYQPNIMRHCNVAANIAIPAHLPMLKSTVCLHRLLRF